MKVLVTGAKGFVGTAIVSELIASGHEVVQIGSHRLMRSGRIIENSLPYAVDITDLQELDVLKSIDGVDVVVHSAGLAHQFGDVSKEQFFRVNVDGTQNICRLAAEIKAAHMILISSVSVYGKSGDPELEIDENVDCQPDGFYAESKFEAENAARKICSENKIALTILRPATVIGEGDIGNVARLIREIDKRRFLWVGKGQNLKSFIYKNDLASACLAVLVRKSGATEIFNVSAKPLKMKELVQMIEAKLDKKILPIVIPVALVKKFLGFGMRFGLGQKFEKLSGTIEKWIANDNYSSDKLREIADFKPKTTISDAIGLEVEWYLKNK